MSFNRFPRVSTLIAAAGIAAMTWGLAPATAATVLIDIGDSGQQSNTDTLGRTWNNIAGLNNGNPGDDVTNSPHSLKTSANQSSGWTLSISNPAGVTNPVGFNGANPDGTQSPTGDAAARGYPATATRDSGFGNTETYDGRIVEAVTLTLNGLSQSQTYDLFFFASRMGVSDNREALYSVTGATTASAALNPVGNTGNVASVLNIAPDSGNTITINVSKGPNNTNGAGFFYLGVLEIVAVPEPGTLSILGLGAIGLLRRRRGN